MLLDMILKFFAIYLWFTKIVVTVSRNIIIVTNLFAVITLWYTTFVVAIGTFDGLTTVKLDVYSVQKKVNSSKLLRTFNQHCTSSLLITLRLCWFYDVKIMFQVSVFIIRIGTWHAYIYIVEFWHNEGRIVIHHYHLCNLISYL